MKLAFVVAVPIFLLSVLSTANGKTDKTEGKNLRDSRDEVAAVAVPEEQDRPNYAAEVVDPTDGDEIWEDYDGDETKVCIRTC